MVGRRNRRGIWLLVLYLPISGLVIGLVANLSRLPVPATGSRAFGQVFWAHALRFPSDFSILRWIAPILGWGILLLMLVAVRTGKPIISLFEIRIVLLVLIVIVTFLAKIFTVVLTVAPQSGQGLHSHSSKDLLVLLFLFVDVDLILVLLASYLRIFKPLNRRLV